MTQALRQKEHVERVKLYRVSPEPYEAMQVLSSAAANGIEPDLAELIKIPASQMNRCVFCLDMHSHDARNRGVSTQNSHSLPRGRRRARCSPNVRGPR